MEERREAGGGGGVGGGGGWEEWGFGQQSGGEDVEEIEGDEGGEKVWGRVGRGGGWKNFGRGGREFAKNNRVPRRARVIIFLTGSEFGEPMKKKEVRTHSINRTLC